MGKTDHGDNCQGENGGVKTAWGKCLWGFTDRISIYIARDAELTRYGIISQ